MSIVVKILFILSGAGVVFCIGMAVGAVAATWSIMIDEGYYKQ